MTRHDLSRRGMTLSYGATVPDDLSRAVAAEIRRLMDARKVSGYALAKATGIPQSSISRKLNGEAPFDLDDVQKVSRALDVDEADLIAWSKRTRGDHPSE